MDTVLWILVGVVCGVGVLGNVTSLVVFFRQSNKLSVSYWLIALTSVDLVGLLCSPLFVYTWPCTPSDRSTCRTDALPCDLPPTVRRVLCSMHALLIAGMCADRYIAVTKPAYCQVWLSKTKTIAVIVLVGVICVSLHLPEYAIGTPNAGRPGCHLAGTMETPSANTGSGAEYFSRPAGTRPDVNKTLSGEGGQVNQTTDVRHAAPPSRRHFDVSWTAIRDHVVYRWVYVFGIRHLAMFLLPVLAVAVFLFLVLVRTLALKRALLRKRSTKGRYIKTYSYTMVVAGVSIICILCSLPLIVEELVFEWLRVEHTERSNQIAPRLRVAVHFVLLSVNICVYLVADGKFRRDLCRCIECRR